MMLAQIKKPNTDFQAFFRYRQVKDRIVLTNYEGSYTILTEDQFRAYLEGSIAKDSALYQDLRAKNFVRAEFDMAKAVERLRLRKRHLNYGPNLHVMVVTLRCNETCVYCHASRADMDAVHTDMTTEIAEKSVDLALQSTSPAITIEFQGGEPLVNFPVVKHIIAYALERNKTVGKQLEFTMVTNLSLMDEEKMKFLLENRVQLCTSVDGPANLHDKQRKLPGLSAHKAASFWIRRINQAYGEMGLDTSLYHVEALLTTTRETLPRWKEVVDTYVDLGCRALFLRPLDPFGFAEKTGGRTEYPRAEYHRYYRDAVDYMIELNKQGVQILERYAAIFLTKIMSGEDPNFLDIRNPVGAGIGQMAYSYDGKIYTCDEGRMLGGTGDDMFLIGDVRTSKYRDLVGHETVRATILASSLDAQPDCVNCAYNPYCGIVPAHNYKTQGSIWGRMRESNLCAVHKGIQDYLFGKMIEGDPATMEILQRWTTVRPREHFLQTETNEQHGSRVVG
ncbi:MAG: His-Xaa-Ser system radical SAM maturase HxsB [Thermoanaerobaculia bacterium]